MSLQCSLSTYFELGVHLDSTGVALRVRPIIFQLSSQELGP
jgi:hypothetical protein